MKTLPTNIKDYMNKFEKENNAKILYLTEYGSKLYGTDNENSDTDYVGVFIQDIDTYILKNDISHHTSSTGKKDENNSKDDIDISLFSLNRFFGLVRKGETGALDILFSIDSPSVVYKDEKFTSMLMSNLESYVHKNMRSFLGYSMAQISRYSKLGSQLTELQNFIKLIESLELKESKDAIGEHFKDFDFSNNKYIKFTISKGANTRESEYIDILGKLYHGKVKTQYFLDKIKHQETKYGKRTRAASKNYDTKSISHARRVLSEVDEIIETGRVVFPLKNANYIKLIKENKINIESVLEELQKDFLIIKEKINKSKIREKSDRELMDRQELIIVKSL